MSVPIVVHTGVHTAVPTAVQEEHVAWPADLEEQIRRMWMVEGLSASEVSLRLGGLLSRNAVLAGANRRWGPRGDSRESRALQAKLDGRANNGPGGLNGGFRPATFKKMWGVHAENHVPGPASATLLRVRAGGCRWWVGPDVEGGEQLFCGERRRIGSMYCEGHGALAVKGLV